MTEVRTSLLTPERRSKIVSEFFKAFRATSAREFVFEIQEPDTDSSFCRDLTTGNRPELRDSDVNWGIRFFFPNDEETERLQGTPELLGLCTRIEFTDFGYNDDADYRNRPTFSAEPDGNGGWVITKIEGTDFTATDVDSFLLDLRRN